MSSNFKIEYINENDYNRIFVTSDIHGYYNLFEKLLNKIDLKKDDLLIILGDSCDRGENSIELYLKYIELQEQGYQVKHIWEIMKICFMKVLLFLFITRTYGIR